MPGSLLARSRVARHESTRSDRSDVSAYSNTSQNSGKKVSFNKAVRVKKYPRQKKIVGSGGVANGDTPNGSLVNGGSPSPEKRFWFKVYKNKHRQAPDPSEFRSNDVIHYGPAENGFDDVSYDPNPSSPLIIHHIPVLTAECGTQTPGKKGSNGIDSSSNFRNESIPLHPSQMPTDPPHVRKNHVKKIVNRFNEEAVLKRQKSSDGEISPPSSPRHHHHERAHEVAPAPPPPPPPPPQQPQAYSAEQRQSPDGQSASKSKKNPIVNGVKVIFGMAQLKRRENKSNGIHDKNVENTRRSRESSSRDVHVPNGEVHHHSRKTPYKTEIVISDGSETEVKTPERRYLTHKTSGNREKKWSGGKTNNSYERERVDGGGQLVRAEIDDDYDYYREEEEDDDFFGREGRRGKVHVETWDTGDQLIFDTTDINASSERTSEGQFLKTVGEKHQLWRNDRRTIVYEEPSPRPNRRKAKSQNDLTDPDREEYYLTQEKMDKGVSTEQLFSRKEEKREGIVSSSSSKKDSWLKNWRSHTRDKGVQCSKVPTGEDEEFLNGKYRVIRSKNGVVSAYSDVPYLDKRDYCPHPHKTVGDDHGSSFLEMRNGAIYSQVDKSKKKKNGTKERKKKDTEDKPLGGLFKSRSEPLYIGPPPKTSSQQHEEEEQVIYFEEKPEKKVKSSKRSFGFRLKTNRDDVHDNRRANYREENWYDVDDELEAAEMQKRRGGGAAGHHDIAEVRQELAEEGAEGVSDVSSVNGGRGDGVAGSVMREVDFKKREISYENVPRAEEEFGAQAGAAAGSGLWHRDAEEDYRKEMAQSEVSYPAGSHVGSERFYTLGRAEKGGRRDASPGPRAYTLDRRHLKEKERLPNTSGVKILVNGKEVDDVTSGGTTRKSKGHHRKGRVVNEDPSSVQSDPLYVRGGLAAAYQARQRAAIRRSNSSAAGMTGGYRSKRSPALDRRGQDHGSSAASAASSESDSTRQRRPLVMYIPGISHPERSADDADRSSGVNVARSQSMMTSSRPPRIIPRQNKGHKSANSNRNNNIYEEDEIMPLTSDSKRKSRISGDSKKQSDIRRRHSMPKDTKFSWLKWRIKGKPSREP